MPSTAQRQQRDIPSRRNRLSGMSETQAKQTKHGLPSISDGTWHSPTTHTPFVLILSFSIPPVLPTHTHTPPVEPVQPTNHPMATTALRPPSLPPAHTYICTQASQRTAHHARWLCMRWVGAVKRSLLASGGRDSRECIGPLAANDVLNVVLLENP